MATHLLKTWPEPFADAWYGRKRFEVRRFDREFQLGDVLELREYLPGENRYTGAWIRAEVRYITPPGTWGLPADIGVLGIAVHTFSAQVPLLVGAGGQAAS
jgi:hypothetical protein